MMETFIDTKHHLAHYFFTFFLFMMCNVSSAEEPSSLKQKQVFPIIKNFGPAVAFPDAAFKADKELTYKIVFDITKSAKSDNDVNSGLAHIAKFLNIMGSEEFPLKKIELVGIFHGDAGTAVLQDRIYSEKYGKPNPNTELISVLKQNGVKLFICGQTLAQNNLKTEWVNPDVDLADSAMVVLSTYQLKGFAWMVF